jgi:3-oxoacyl-[acyl-carrier protein] reductase
VNLERYFGLSGKNVLLTGATGGIGAAMAEAFSAAGANLILSSNEPEPLREAAERLPSALAVPCDVSDTAQLNALISSAHSHFGAGTVKNGGVPNPKAGRSDVSR